ncbi:MAG: T9SS type A sorting domain-containing protein [Flavobacteriales bacterium]|nr:T9SS type A sorting domain-containing protein [Flavobacteriales bacterium]
MEDLQAGSDGLKVVPDPARDRAELWVEGTGERTSIQVLDPLGRVVRSVLDGMLMEGPHKISLRVDGLRSGMYLVQVTTADERRVVRFTLE